MGFKRMRSGEQRDKETAENEEVVEVETGNSDTTQNQTQAVQRGAARSNALPDNIGNLAKYFTQHTPPARRAVNAEGRRTKTPGKQAALSEVGIEVTPVVVGGSGTANVLGPVPEVDVMAKRSQEWVKLTLGNRWQVKRRVHARTNARTHARTHARARPPSPHPK
jgi:hypothetical protein